MSPLKPEPRVEQTNTRITKEVKTTLQALADADSVTAGYKISPACLVNQAIIEYLIRRGVLNP